MKGGGVEILYLLYRLDPELVRAKNSMKQTPLFYAAKMGNLEAVVFLLRVGCKADDRDSNEQTPLHYASQNSRNKIFNFFVKKFRYRF